MTVRPNIIRARLLHLASSLAHLQTLRAFATSERLDPLRILAAERAMQVAIEAVFDIGHHLLAGRGRPIPATYREVIPALVADGVVAPELGSRLGGMAGFRNILVHDYADVLPDLLWSAIDDHLEDLRAVHQALASIPELRS
jgi:uncharacterized protein YutE (UPF0331/DUF86 family)